jgi:hypothetical protein
VGNHFQLINLLTTLGEDAFPSTWAFSSDTLFTYSIFGIPDRLGPNHFYFTHFAERDSRKQLRDRLSLWSRKKKAGGRLCFWISLGSDLCLYVKKKVVKSSPLSPTPKRNSNNNNNNNVIDLEHYEPSMTTMVIPTMTTTTAAASMSPLSKKQTRRRRKTSCCSRSPSRFLLFSVLSLLTAARLLSFSGNNSNNNNVLFVSAASSMNTCHSTLYKEKPAPSNCTHFAVPLGLCEVCKFDRVLSDGQFHDCSQIYNISGTTSNSPCVAKIQEYVNLNPCDTPRADALSKFLGAQGAAKVDEGRQVLDFFVYALCEGGCDCIPLTGADRNVPSISVERGNCQV